jgi:hypothetical protein
VTGFTQRTEVSRGNVNGWINSSLNANAPTTVAYNAVPDYAASGYGTPPFTFNMTRYNNGRWTTSINWFSTLPTDLANTSKWVRLYIDDTAGSNANNGTTKALALRDIFYAINSLTVAAQPAAFNVISAMTGNAVLIQVTTTSAHFLATGDYVTITGCTGNTAANGTWQVTVIDSTNYTLNGSLGNGTYTANSGAMRRRIVYMMKPGGSWKFTASGNGQCWNGGQIQSDSLFIPWDGTRSSSTWTSSMELPDLTGWANLASRGATVWRAGQPATAGSPGTPAVFDFGQLDKLNRPVRLTLASDTAGVYSTPNTAIVAGNTNVTTTTGNGVSPIVVTTSGTHKFTTGDSVTISGVVGNTAANGTFTITYVGTNQFSLDGTTGNGAYSSGGYVAYAYIINLARTGTPADGSIDFCRNSVDGQMAESPFKLWVKGGIFRYGDRCFYTSNIDKTITGASNPGTITITTSAAHGYNTGDSVTIVGVTGNTAANGTWVITVTGTTTFTLNSSTASGAYVSGGLVQRNFYPLLAFESCQFSFSTGSGNAGFYSELPAYIYLFNCQANDNESDGFNFRRGRILNVNWIANRNGCLSTSAPYLDYRTSGSWGTNQGETIHRGSVLYSVNGQSTQNGGQGRYHVGSDTNYNTAYIWDFGGFSWSQRGDTTNQKGNADFGGGNSTDVVKYYMYDPKAVSPDGAVSTSDQNFAIQDSGLLYPDIDLTGGVSAKLKVSGTAATTQLVIV